ncbi:MAG: hypothetical protein ABSC08_05215 [Bryobacteraceae bacterium]
MDAGRRCFLGRDHFATGWKGHTLRGFISTLASKHGFVVNSDLACEN